MSLVTTALPIYNGERFLRHALDSLVAQTRKPDRVVVLDDGSTDNSADIVASYRSVLPVEYRLNPRRLGVFGNHNQALQLGIETDFLHILHQDDVLLPDFFARILSELGKVNGLGLGWCHAERIDGAGNPLGTLVPVNAGPPEWVKLDDFLGERARLWADIYVSGAVLKTDRRSIPCRFREDTKQVGDFYFWAAWARHAVALIRLREVHLHYRDHPLSASWQNQTDLEVCVHEVWKVIEDIETMRGRTGLVRMARMHKLRCFFAAFIHVQMDNIRARSPDLMNKMRRVGRLKVGGLHWWLGKMAFHTRKLLRAVRGG